MVERAKASVSTAQAKIKDAQATLQTKRLECEALAAATAEVTHNHHEGIKGAVAVAGAIYLARTGSTMDEIKEYIKLYYSIDFTLDEIRPFYEFNETCQDTVPQAITMAFRSNDRKNRTS